jgi:hypothetical protein
VAQVCNFLSQTKPYNTDVNCYITTLWNPHCCIQVYLMSLTWICSVVMS